MAAPTPGIILFLGDSITAGYGLDLEQAFPALIQEKIDAKRWNFKVVNAGQSGDTSAGGLSRLEWLLEKQSRCFGSRARRQRRIARLARRNHQKKSSSDH